MKTCFKCGAEKPREEFYNHPEMKDGTLGKCKECARRDVREHRAANIDRYRERERRRIKSTEVLERQAMYLRQWRQLHRDRARAHVTANRACLSAPSACERCAKTGRVEKHHPDYSQPLLVEWLCKPCHHLADKERRALEVLA
jgi:hypothetical protein